MGYFNFENSPSEKTPISAENLLAMQQGLMEIVFPIGSTYITQSNTNPSTILNFGTWERFKGKVSVGLDEDDADKYFDEIGKTGGEKKHTQTIEELVNHTHESPKGGYFVEDGGSGTNMYTQSGNNYATKTSSPERSVKATGNSKPFNITQPYEVVGYMWIRRS